MLLSTSNHNSNVEMPLIPSVVKYLLSTSNHNCPLLIKEGFSVVKYLLSTSNHNRKERPQNQLFVVKYLLSTSNHNGAAFYNQAMQLSNIFFLHQTTTGRYERNHIRGCQISSFYIKPQLERCVRMSRRSCQISSFYIKPQHVACWRNDSKVVKYLLSTSNHNSRKKSTDGVRLSNIFFLHQTTTESDILADHIKLSNIFFLHQTTTNEFLYYPIQ